MIDGQTDIQIDRLIDRQTAVPVSRISSRPQAAAAWRWSSAAPGRSPPAAASGGQPQP